MTASRRFSFFFSCIVFCLFSGLAGSLSAQLTVTASNNGQQLANAITGNGVIVTNVTLNCPAGASGTFEGFNSNVGLDSGIVLTSGSVINAVGPNNSGSTTAINGGGADPDLTAIAGVNTFDACALEFDLIPYCDTIQIRYVFGSEEYDEYVCANVNDAFAFLITGPGYPTPTNLAVIPGTNIPVSINSVNNGMTGTNAFPPFPATCNLGNSAFYTTNNGGVSVQYDGMTVALTAFAAVQACDTYRLKIAIADGGDGSFDSGVFLEQNGISCTSNPVFVDVEPYINDPNSPTLVEDCINGGFTFSRGGDISQPTTLSYTVGGSATNGLDYSPLSGNVFFPAGIASVDVPVNAFLDPPVEGIEDIIVIVTDSVCFSSAADTAVLQIDDLPTSDAGPDLTFCGGDTMQLLGVPFPGGSYQWISNTGLSDDTIPDPFITLNQGGVFDYIFNVTLGNGCVATDTARVTVLPSPQVTASNDTSFCEGEGGVGISALATGGVAPLYYVWWCDSTSTFCGIDSINDNDPHVNPDTTTEYYVQITGSNGCLSNVDTVLVTELPKPLVDAGPDMFICGDSAPGVILTPTITQALGPYQYQWTPAAGLNSSTIENPFARPDSTTIYTLVVTAGNGCTSDFTTLDTNATVTVHVNPVPVAIAHIPADSIDLCLGDSVQLQGTAFGAGPQYDYSWSPVTAVNTPTSQSPWVSPIITTEYILTVFSNGCPSYGDTVRINVHTLPTVDAGIDSEICLGASQQLNGSAGGDSSTSYIYAWEPAIYLNDSTLEDPIATPDSTTQFYLTATSEWGCVGGPDSVTVFLKPTPIAEAGRNVEICEGDTIMITGTFFYTSTEPANPSEVYFGWSPNQFISDTTINNPEVWPPSSQFYYLEVRHEDCVTYDSMLVQVYPQPIAGVTGDTTVICGQDSVQLYATGGLGGATYTWMPPNGLSNPAAAEPMASPDTTTNYIVIVSEGKCVDTADITIEVIPRPEAAFIQSALTGCAPLTVNFLDISQDAENYVWDLGDGSLVQNIQNPEHVYETPGTYTVSLLAIGPGFCQDSAPEVQVIVGEGPIADFMSDPSYPAELVIPSTSVQFTDMSENATWVRWDFGDGTFSDLDNPSHTYTAEGTYYVSLVASSPEGCVDTVQHGPYVILIPQLFIPNVFSPNADGINDLFRPDYSGSQPYVLQIFDRWGVKLYDSNNKTQGWNGQNESGVEVPEGTYYYRVEVGDKEYAGDVTLVR